MANTEPVKEKTSAIGCTSCGAPLKIRLPGKTQAIACEYCGSVLDTTSKEFKIIDKYEKDTQIQPLFPLSSRGIFEGEEFEFIGFVRKKGSDGSMWDEYLLYNPYLGFRYLAFWSGHWSYIRMLRGFPFDFQGKPILEVTSNNRAFKQGRAYKHFYSYGAEVQYVLGEFNWKVRKGESTNVVDFIAPPHILTGEYTKNQAVWSKGFYTTPKEVRKAFALKDPLPKPRGVAPNQPNIFTFKAVTSLVISLAAMALVVIMGARFESASENKEILRQAIAVSVAKEPIKVQKGERYKEFEHRLGVIEIPPGLAKNLEIKISTRVRNQWMFLTFYLMNEQTRKGHAFSELISFYEGYADGEHWSEGSKSGLIVTEKLEPGSYLAFIVGQTNIATTARATITIKRDVVPWFIASIMIVGLWLPVIYYFIRRKSFETARNA